MICKYCHHEFSVDVDTLGQELHCPNCSSTVLISDKDIICKCPFCKTQLSAEMWMIGTTVPCPVCTKDVKLSLDAASSRDLFGSTPPEAATGLTLQPGTHFGKYKIERCLGIGGMGEVYLATHSFLGTSCAIKLLKKDVTVREEDKQRLLREARLTSSIHHQNLIAVLDADIDPDTGMLYIVMEYVDGISIDQILDNGPMPEERVLQIIREVAEALQAAEEMQLVHRDIKPANIMLSSKGKVKLADLGIAKAGSDSTQTLTMDNAILGTPHYASPEQLKSSHKVDARADIYSLGASMYHMLSGQYPFPGDTIFSIMAQVLEQEPKPLQNLAKVSTLTAQLVSEMMKKNPDDRPNNMTELIARIDRILQLLNIQKMQQSISYPPTPKTTLPTLMTNSAASGKPAQKLELKPHKTGNPVLQELKKTPSQNCPKPAEPLAAEKIRETASAVKPQTEKNLNSKKILLPILAICVLGGIAGAVYTGISSGKTAQEESARTEKIAADLSAETAKSSTLPAAPAVEKTEKNELPQVITTPFVPVKPSALEKPVSVKIAEEARKQTEQFTLINRIKYANEKLVSVQMKQGSQGQNYYNTQALQFYTELHKRLSQELQNRETAEKNNIRQISGRLCERGRSLYDSMQTLLNNNNKWAEYYQTLKNYALLYQNEQQNTVGANAKKSLVDQQAKLLQDLRAGQNIFDPLIFIQAFLLFIHNDEGITAQTMLKVLADAAPDFSYSKFPPEALELPEQVITALLAKCWEEVDGASYGKSNLITELSRNNQGGRSNVIAALLSAGCNIDIADSRGMYPLHWAIRNSTFLRHLLTIAPDMTVQTGGKGIVEWSMEEEVLYSTVRRLIHAGAALPNIPEDDYPPNYRALIHLIPAEK